MWPDFTTLSPKEPNVPSLAVPYLTVPLLPSSAMKLKILPLLVLRCRAWRLFNWSGGGVTKIKILPPSVPGPRDTRVQIGAHGRPQLGCKQ